MFPQSNNLKQHKMTMSAGKILMLALVGGLFFLSTNTPASQGEKISQHITVPMQAHLYYFREHCLHLNTGVQLEYHITTPYAVDFNIHYHTDSSTEYPVKEIFEKELVGNLSVTEAAEYCFMWQNPAARPQDYDIDLKYQVHSLTAHN